MEFLFTDLQHSIRSLRKAPLFTLTAIFCLTLSIGAVSAIFSVFNAVVLDAFPFAEPDDLVDIALVRRDFSVEDPAAVIYSMPQRALDNFVDHQGEARFAWKADRGFAITEIDTPMQLFGDVVSTNYFSVVQPRLLLGRAFSDDDRDRPVAVISYRVWQNSFGATPDILEVPLTIDGERHDIVGVLARDHRYPTFADLWVPEKSELSAGTRLRSRLSYNILGRLGAGESLEQFNQALLAVTDASVAVDPALYGTYRFFGIQVPVLLARNAQLGTTLKMLLAAVLALLVIASANVANLMLSRMQQQEQELSLRAALGARSGRLVRRLLLESSVIAFVSAVFGILLAWVSLPLLVEQAGTLIQNPERVRLNASVLLFSVLVTLVTTLAVSLAPLGRVLTTDLAATLREGGNKGMMGGRQQLRRSLVAAEAALAFMLLVGAGLMIKSFAEIQKVSLGLSPEHLQTFVLYAPASRRENHQQAMAFYDEVAESVAAVAGVESVAFSNSLPFTDRSSSYSMSIEDFPPDGSDDVIEPPPAGEIASYNYLETLGAKLIEGRYLNAQDRRNGLQAVVISENMARHHWPNESAIGKRIKRGTYTEEGFPWWTVVGVVEAISANPTAPPPHRFFRSVSQHELARAYTDMRMLVRTAGEPVRVIQAIRQAVSQVADDAVVANERTMLTRVADGIRTQQLAMKVVLAFGVVGLVLAVAGIFGVFSYNVQQRFREIGLRMVLGARTTDIFILVLRSALGLGALGLGLGFLVALGSKPYIEAYLFNVSALDVPVYLAVTLILLSAILLAACYPARRATRTDPVNTLRHQ